MAGALAFALTYPHFAVGYQAYAGGYEADADWYQAYAGDLGTSYLVGCTRPGPAGHPVTVAVIDSGITLISQLDRSTVSAQSRSFVPGEALDQDDLHGTEMAAIIHRAAPGARLLILKALDDQEGGSQGNLAAAIRYAARHGARVINLSAAGADESPSVTAAIVDANRRGVLVVVAAGNQSLDIDTYPTYPASLRAPNLVAVAATDGRGHLAANSNWGVHSVALGAPGVDVATFTTGGGATQVSGTSPAAALVSGALAQALAVHPKLSATALRRSLINSAARTPGLRAKTMSGGQLDAGRMYGCGRSPTSST